MWDHTKKSKKQFSYTSRFLYKDVYIYIYVHAYIFHKHSFLLIKNGNVFLIINNEL